MDKKMKLAGKRAPRVNAGIIRARSGFTLLELITVIIIILLLTGILLPSIIRAKDLAYRSATRAYISQLESGALRYQQERQYFPGQEDPGIMGTGASDYTGSQVLVSELMGISRDGSGGFITTTPPDSPYVEYNEDRVAEVNGRLYTPIDSFPGNNAQAILYYPSRLGNDGRVGTALGDDQGAFCFTDNGSYTGTDANIREDFRVFNWDRRFGISDNGITSPVAGSASDRAYNSDTFLLLGKGLHERNQAASWFSESSPRNF